MRISDWSSDVCSSDLIDVSEGREQLGELHHQEPVLTVRLVALWLSFLRFVPAETRNAIEIAAQCFKGVRTQIAGAFTLGKKAVNLHQRQMVADRINIHQYLASVSLLRHRHHQRGDRKSTRLNSSH